MSRRTVRSAGPGARGVGVMPVVGQVRYHRRQPVPRPERPPYLSPPMTSTAPSHSPATPPAARRGWIDWLVAVLWLGAIVGAAVQQGGTHQHNNFLIFRAASRHLIAGSDLYTLYPAEH